MPQHHGAVLRPRPQFSDDLRACSSRPHFCRGHHDDVVCGIRNIPRRAIHHDDSWVRAGCLQYRRAPRGAELGGTGAGGTCCCKHRDAIWRGGQSTSEVTRVHRPRSCCQVRPARAGFILHSQQEVETTGQGRGIDEQSRPSVARQRCRQCGSTHPTSGSGHRNGQPRGSRLCLGVGISGKGR